MGKKPRPALDKAAAGDKQNRKRQPKTETAPSRDAWLAAIVFGSRETKVPVNIRLDADIVRYFRDAGPGYQTRINEVLRTFVHARMAATERQPAAAGSKSRRKRGD